jgi:ATP-dependent DNA helicase RecG
LVIIDEQHRFGVSQRGALVKPQQKIFPHILTMTATPIPRSAALVFYNHLDLSLLKDKPKNQQPIKTWLIPEVKRDDAYRWLKKQIDQEGAQIFIVCPLIEKSNQSIMKGVRSAKSEYDYLQKTVFTTNRLALIHGQTKEKARDKIIKDFAAGKIDILVATSIIEVGLDIPGATIMLIEGAERFGLAQLHQLRGRVGRNNRQAYCLLFTNSQPNSEAYQRLKILEKNQSGLSLAKLDLAQRGPGEILGTAQHGFPQLKIANLNDFSLIARTNYWAKILAKRENPYSSLKKRPEEDTISQIELS